MAKEVVPDFETSDDEQAYEVERIIAQRKVDGLDQYLVKWTNFGDEDCTWEPADSFDQNLSISPWEEARARGDVLDETELQDVEKRMARRAADHAKKEAARQESNINKPACEILPDSSETVGKTARTEETTLTEKDLTTSLHSIAAKRKAPQSIRSTPRAEPAKRNQEFHGLGDKPQPIRRTTGMQTTTSDTRTGKTYRNLSHQNNAQRRRAQEPAPNTEQLGTLRPAIELVSAHDVALNLPSGLPLLSLIRNPTQETFVASAEGQFKQVTESDAVLMSPDKSTAGPNGQEPTTTKPPRYQQISHAVFQSPPRQDQDTRFIRFGNEYFYHKWGELVVQMRFGARLIDHVKVSGLPSHMISALLWTREGPVLGMTFEQEEANELEEYRSFSRGYEVSAIGSTEPFDIAKEGFYDLLDFFNTHAKATGVWRPKTTAKIPWIMIVYSSRSAKFSEKGFPTISGGLAFIVCTRVPWHNAPLVHPQPQFHSENSDAHVPSHSGQDALETSKSMEIDSTPPATAPADTISAPQPMIGVEPTISLAQVNKEESSHHVAQTEAVKESAVIQKQQVEALGEGSVVGKQQGREKMKMGQLIFEEKYGITYEYLTRVPATVKNLLGMAKLQRNLIRFFLAFDEDKSDEEAELKIWLSSRTPAHMIFTCSNEYDWDRFKDFMQTADHVGIILIHEDFMGKAFGFMNGLAKKIRREDIQIFHVSLGRPLYDLWLRHFGRIFPSGLVLLITEGSIIGNARGTTDLFAWFLKSSKGKKNWRLFLRPHAEQYLRDLCETDMSEEDWHSHVQSLVHLKALDRPFETTSSSLASPNDHQVLSSYVLAPLSLSVYSKGDENASQVSKDTKTIRDRDAKLLDFFCGWASTQVASFRRFVAVTGHVSEDHRKHNAHVDFLTLGEFE